tara:strand:- start:724 stop:1800 length:1077 start_codon:yes stop_codon:yes gene_type:complete
MATQIIKNRPSWLGTLNIGDYASTIAMEYGAEAADNTVLADVSRSNTGGLLTFGFSADTYADYTNADLAIFNGVNTDTGFGPELKGLVSQWTLNDAASHTLTDPSTITVNNTSGGSDYTGNIYVVNAEYSVTYTVSNYSAGIVGLSFGSGAINIARTGNGTYTETGINSGSPLIYVLSNTGTQCTIVIDSIKKVSDAVPLTFATESGAEYETAFLINALQVSATPISGTVGDMAGANISGNAVGRLVKGIIGANRLSATNSVIPTGSQLGPVAAGQSIYVNLHVTAATVAAGGYLVLYVQSDDNPNFTSYTNRVNFDYTSEVSSQSLSLAGPITDEYWRATCYISNGSFSVAVSLGIA